MNSLITIYIGSTRCRVCIPIKHPLMLPIREVLRRRLSEYAYNPRTHQYELLYRFYRYNKRRNELLIPINALFMITDELDMLGGNYTIKNESIVEGRAIETKLNESFKPRDDQKDIIEYMKNDDPVRSLVGLQTGKGKTVVSIAASIMRGKCCMVVVSGLVDQWVKQYRAFSNVGERIVVVQGIKSLIDLIESDYKPDVIVFSLETLRLYVLRAPNYEDLPPYEKFIEYFGIDTKIFDEVHRAHNAFTIIDLHSNIKKNIYLTATYNQTSAQARRIFNIIYPPEQIRGLENRDRYIRVWSYGYRIHVPERVYHKLRGYSHIKYEAYFYKRPTKLNHFFTTVLSPVINAHFINRCKPGQRCLIYFSTIDMIMAAYQYLKKEYPQKKVGVYIGESKEGSYNDYEIVVSNHKKAGTGLDMKELYLVINTVSFSTPMLTEQSLGRLRKLPNGETPEYIDLVNVSCSAQLMHRAERRRILEALALEYRETILP